jgi:hypothetical protein
MKKLLIIFGAIFVIFLLVSNATAVSQINSEPIMKKVSDTKKQIKLIGEKLEFYKGKIGNININIYPTGIFDFLIAILNFLIDLINSIIDFILEFMELGALILTFINALRSLINVINQFIDWIQDFFDAGITPTFQ